MLAVLIGSALCVPSLALAQGPDEPGFRGWGPRVGVTLDPDQIHFGVHIDFGNFAERVRFQPNAELGASLIGGIEKGLADGDRFFIEAKLGLIDAPDLKIHVGWTFF
jgi:hypothetical protein